MLKQQSLIHSKLISKERAVFET